MELIDLAILSLEEFCDAASCRRPNSTSAHSRRDITDALATVHWYAWVHSAAANATPYAISQIVEPNSHWSKGAGERFHRNKWSKYARGQHRPSDVLVDATERLFPGSSRQIRHPLWMVLKHPPNSERAIEALEALLRPEVQALIVRWRPRARGGTSASISPLASRLERAGSLDGLTAMILQLCGARLVGQLGIAREWAWHVYRCLILISDELLQHGVAMALFELVELRLLQHASHEGWRYSFPSSLYLEAGAFLAEVVYHIDGVDYISLTPSQRVRYKQKTLGSDYGYDCQFALNPFKKVDSSALPLSQDLLREITRGLHFFIWAWNMRTEHGPHPWFPPLEVHDGTDLHAWAPESERPSKTKRPPCDGA